MNVVTKRMTLEEYLNYDNGTEKRYELVDGVLIEMPPESDRNNLIAIYLMTEFLKVVSFHLIRHKDTEIVVSGYQARVRVPDLIILTQELFEALQEQKRGTITIDMPPPVLVVEVVSPGKENENRDYRYKRSEYAARGIAEYWIVDPIQAKVTVLTLVEGLYEVAEYKEREQIVSAQLSQLRLAVEQVLQAGS